MEMAEKLREIADYMAKNPRLLQAEGARKTVGAFERSLAAMHRLVRDQLRTAHPDYQALRQALGSAAQRLPKAWLAEMKKAYAGSSSKKVDPIQSLAISIFDAGDAQKILMDLKKSPELRHQEELSAVARLEPSRGADNLMKKYKGADLERFFRDNNLPVTKKKNRQGDAVLDTARMKAALVERLSRIHDRL